MTVTLKSERHPGTSPPGLVYARGLVRPLATCLLPVMIVASLLVLTSMDPLSFLAWSVPLAYLIATGWTFYELGRVVVEVRLDEEWAAVLTIWDVARGEVPESWSKILMVKDDGDRLLVSHGRSVLEFLPEEWPEFDLLQHSLRNALMLGRVRQGEIRAAVPDSATH